MMRHTLALIAGLGLLAGCKTIELPTLAKTKAPETQSAKPANPASPADPSRPARLVAIWADAIYSEVGKPPVRGFGGRFYFYDQSNQAVPVEGQLVVYAYDDSLEGVPANAASMKYVFTADQFAQHHSPTELGDSYSIWLPWDPVGGERKAISLVPVFTTTSGQVLPGQPSLTVLPGKAPAVQPKRRTGYFTDPDGQRRNRSAHGPPGSSRRHRADERRRAGTPRSAPRCSRGPARTPRRLAADAFLRPAPAAAPRPDAQHRRSSCP